MPQQTLFDGWNITRMSVSVELPVNVPGGRITFVLFDENGRPAGQRTAQWMKVRDMSDLGLVLRELADAFLFAPQMEMLETLKQSVARHLPEVPSGQ